MLKWMSEIHHLIWPWKIHTKQDDIIKWKHFPRNWPFVRGIHRLPMNSPHKGQWRGALMLSLICAWINGWVNNGEAGDWDAIVLIMTSPQWSIGSWMEHIKAEFVGELIYSFVKMLVPSQFIHGTLLSEMSSSMLSSDIFKILFAILSVFCANFFDADKTLLSNEHILLKFKSRAKIQIVEIQYWQNCKVLSMDLLAQHILWNIHLKS